MYNTDNQLITHSTFYFPQRVPLAIAQQERNMWRPYKFSYPSNAHFGDDLMLMNVSSDTLGIVAKYFESLQLIDC